MNSDWFTVKVENYIDEGITKIINWKGFRS